MSLSTHAGSPGTSDRPNLAIVIASTRPRRTGSLIADWIADVARTHGAFNVGVADLAEIDLPLLDEPEHPSAGVYEHEHTRRWSATIEHSDAFVFVTPEYNRGMAAPLKNALDYLSDEWAYKPAGFVSYGMTSAGLRAVEGAVPVLTALRMTPVPDAVSIPLRQRLDERGGLRPDDAMVRSGNTMLTELNRLAVALRPLREASIAPTREAVAS